MPCCSPIDLLWVQITQSYPNRLRFSSLPCPQSPCHTVIYPVVQAGFLGMEECSAHLVQTFQTHRRIGVYVSFEEHLPRGLTRQGLQDISDSGNIHWVCLLWKNVSVGGGLRRMSHGPQHFEINNWQGKGCHSVCRITISITWPE